MKKLITILKSLFAWLNTPMSNEELEAAKKEEEQAYDMYWSQQ